ncbi:hypothetical protein [Streptomyces sp. KR55]|uniref:hypothetical protein n=1 Tax=Streptomyces sp. KR55 TaxID=3457425 RepID=UPI003FD19F3A
MSAPIPRPPGLWRALARDGLLNPEEAAARAAVIAEHAARVTAAEAEAGSAEPKPALPPRERLVPYEELLERAGWRIVVTATDERARLEAFHRDAVIMVTASLGGASGARRYVLPAAGRGTPHWRPVNLAGLEHFAATLQLPPKTKRVRLTSKCTCDKRRYPSEAIAKDAIVEVTIKRVVKMHTLQSERRAYRCPDDDRVWHLTAIAKWYDDKPQKARIP